MFVPFRGALSEGLICDDTTFPGGIEREEGWKE